jgi:hypothetical protein
MQPNYNIVGAHNVNNFNQKSQSVPKDSDNEEFFYTQMLDGRIIDERVRVYMLRLREMGFKDFDKNLATLNQCCLNFEKAIEKLLE